MMPKGWRSMITLGNGGQAHAGQPSRGKWHSPLGLGPLEKVIMQALWNAAGWVTVQHVREAMDYHRPVAYSTVATVLGNLCDKGLVHRELGDRAGHPGSGVWWYRAARPKTEHIGELIANLLDHSPSPAAALAHALTTAQRAIQINVLQFDGRRAPGAGCGDGHPRRG